VGDAVYRSVRDPAQPTIFVPLNQATWAPTGMTAQLSLSIRSTQGPPVLLSRSVERGIGAVNPELTVNFTSLADRVAASLAQDRIVALLSAAFAALGLVLASVGLYGVTAYAVSRRRTEIAVRMAMGATASAVIRLIVRRVSALAAIGVTIGALASLWASRFVASLLYGVAPQDPIIVLGAALTLVAVVLLASLLPAFRASQTDAAATLRSA